jgi:phosphoheptose isomerase
MPYIAQIHDQQMCEDVIQALLHQVVEQAFQVCQNSNPAKFKEYRTTYLKQIEQALTRISPACLENISRDIKNAFVTGHNVFLIAPEGDGPGISAEHTAHNLNWDAVYQVENPPKRYIFSTPTHCDYSGIGNDRIADGIVSMQQLEKARRGDVLLLFAYDSNSMCVKNTRKYAKDKGLTIYTLCGKGQGEICYRTNDPLVSADVMQMTGHMIGRIVRNMLKGSLDYDCLITEDLAQRRLIAERIEGL